MDYLDENAVVQAAESILRGIHTQPKTIEEEIRAFLSVCRGPAWRGCALQANLLNERVVYTASLAHVILADNDVGAAVAVECYIVDKGDAGWYVAPPSPVSGY